MQLKWIEDLLVLERTRSFSRGAQLRHVTQSALSRRIRSLEEWAGAELVDRNTYPLALTRAGTAFCQNAREALALLLDARAAVRRDATLPDRTIEIAAGHTLSLTFLPSWLNACRDRFGAFNARVVAANVIDAVVALSEGRCDLMLGYNHPQVPVSLDPERFQSLGVGSDMLIPVSVPAPHGGPRFALRDPAHGATRGDTPFLAYTPDTTLGRVVDAVLERRQAHRLLVRCYEADMSMLLLKMASEGHGIAWLPHSTVAPALADGTLVPAGDDGWSSALQICAYRAMHSVNPTLQALWRMMEGGEGGAAVHAVPDDAAAVAGA